MLDTLIVRSVLVTALNLDVGRHMWWPSSLANTPDSERQPRRATVAHEGATSGALRRTQTD
jgi:RND superfamily putative drug exporter